MMQGDVTAQFVHKELMPYPKKKPHIQEASSTKPRNATNQEASSTKPRNANTITTPINTRLEEQATMMKTNRTTNTTIINKSNQAHRISLNEEYNQVTLKKKTSVKF